MLSRNIRRRIYHWRSTASYTREMPAAALVHRRPGRPAVGTRIPVRLPPDVLEDIDRRARLLGRSRASIIRSLLEAALGRTDADAGDDGVDRAQIQRMLALSPPERLRHMREVATQLRRVQGKARRPNR